MRIGSLFSGYGGLDLAALQLFPQSSVAWHCEWDDAPAKILDHHWPTVPNLRDVTEVDWTAVEPVDILTGGYPCQPFYPDNAKEQTMNDTSGPTSGTQFAYYDHDSHSWKMWPDIGLWGSIEYSETVPKTGYMSDGRLYELPTSVPAIAENGFSSSFLPTPRAMDGHASMTAPAARDHVAKGNGSLAEVLGAQLHP